MATKKPAQKSRAVEAPVHAVRAAKAAEKQTVDIRTVTADELRAAGVRNGMTDEAICEAVARARGY